MDGSIAAAMNPKNSLQSDYRYGSQQDLLLQSHSFPDPLQLIQHNRNDLFLSGTRKNGDASMVGIGMISSPSITAPDIMEPVAFSRKQNLSVPALMGYETGNVMDHAFDINQADIDSNIYSNGEEGDDDDVGRQQHHHHHYQQHQLQHGEGGDDDENDELDDMKNQNEKKKLYQRKRKRKNTDVDESDVPIVRIITKSNGIPLLTTSKPRRKNNDQSKPLGPSSPFFIFLKQEVPKAKEYLQSQLVSKSSSSSSSSNDELLSPTKIVISQKDVIKEVKRRWHEMNKDQKQIYYEQFKLRLQNFADSKKEPTPELKKMRKRALQTERKNLNLPKRPRPGFIIFCADMREAVKRDNPTLRSFKIQEKLGEMWRNLPSETRGHYENECEKEKERFKQEMEEWKLQNSGVLDPGLPEPDAFIRSKMQLGLNNGSSFSS